MNLAGGSRLLKGKVEFIQYTREATQTGASPATTPTLPAPATTPDHHDRPHRIRDSALSAGIGLLDEVTTHFFGLSSTGLSWTGLGWADRIRHSKSPHLLDKRYPVETATTPVAAGAAGRIISYLWDAEAKKQ